MYKTPDKQCRNVCAKGVGSGEPTSPLLLLKKIINLVRWKVLSRDNSVWLKLADLTGKRLSQTELDTF